MRFNENDFVCEGCRTIGYFCMEGRTAGNKKIGNGLYCSTGAKLLNDIELGDGALVGANAVVNKTVTESNVLLVGIPVCIKK